MTNQEEIIMKLTGDGKKGIFPFALGQASIQLSFVVIGQLTYALTSSAGMAAGTVGLLLMCSKILDGVTDLIAGYIIDRTNLKLGKARPFDLMALPLWLLVILCFTVPKFSMAGKIIWVLLTFNLCQSVSYTFCSVSSPVRAKRSFDKDHRAKALAAAGIVSAVLATIVSIVLPLLIKQFEARPHGWTIISAIFAIPCMIMSLLMFFCVPEMNADGIEEEKEEKISFATSARYFFRNKYALILVVMLMAAALANIICGTAATYYFKYFIGDMSLQSLVGLVSIISYVFLLFLPALEKRTSHKTICMIAFGMILAGGAGRYIDGRNIVILIIFGILFSIGITVMMTTKSLALMDCMAYGKEKFGMESEGVYSAINGFSDKIANGLGALLVGLILEIGHWDGALAVQPQSALSAIQFMYAGVPAVMGLIGLAATWRFNAEKELKGEKTHE